METSDHSLAKSLQLHMLHDSNGSKKINFSFPMTNFSQEESMMPEPETFLLDFIYALDEYGVPTLLTIGVISNLIISITIRNSELKNVAAYCFLFAMGIVDTLYLIVMAVPWVSFRLVDIYSMEGFCQLVYYLNLLTTFLSSWYFVMLLFERVCACFRQDLAKKFMSAFRVKCYITVFSIFSIVGHLYLTWTSGVFEFNRRKICNVIPDHAEDIMVMRKIDIALGFILPIVLCITLAVPLVIHLCSTICKCNEGVLKVEIKMVTLEVKINGNKRYRECPSGSRTGNIKSTQKYRLWQLSQSRRLTIVVLFISFIYVLLSIPHNVIKTRLTFTPREHIVSFEDSHFLKLFEEIFKVNFAYKGFVYFTCLPDIRESFIALFMPKHKKNGGRNLQTKEASKA